MGNLINLFILFAFAFAFAFNTVHFFEDCIPLISHKLSVQVVSNQDSSKTNLTSSHDDDRGESSQTCPTGQCSSDCQGGHCHPFGLAAVVSILVDPRATPVTIGTLSAHSIDLQKDTRPPRA
jgi:hypothetical protein